MPKKTEKASSSKGKKSDGYSPDQAEDDPPVAKASKDDDSASDESSNTESESENESEGDAAECAAPKKKEEPRFKSLAEQKAHEEELRKEALADQDTIGRLEEVRKRREAARIEREAAEKAQAEAEASAKAEAEAKENARQKALSERPELEVPGPKELKDALTKLQLCSNDDFQKKHGIKGAGGNKLAKIKYADFKKIFDDFQQNAPLEELHKYNGT